jgi:hypothetical protein
MSIIPRRVVIYSKDVSNIAGLSSTASRKLLRDIRNHLGKSNVSLVTMTGFNTHPCIRGEG